MIEIPIGKAMIAVEVKDETQSKCHCCMFEFTCCVFSCMGKSDLIPARKDGKNVIFKLVDYKEERESG